MFDNRFSPIRKKSAEIKCKCSSVKSAELFALDYGVSQLCYLAETLGHLSSKPIQMASLTDSQTTINSLLSVRPIIDRMNQHLHDNVRKCIEQSGIKVKFVGTEDNLADPLTKRITEHDSMTRVMTSRPLSWS